MHNGLTRCLEKNGYNIHGDAWPLSGAVLIYKGYRGVKRSKVVNKNSLTTYNQGAAENVRKYFRSDTLNKNKPYVVNMTVTDSPNMEKAYKNGRRVSQEVTQVFLLGKETNVGG